MSKNLKTKMFLAALLGCFLLVLSSCSAILGEGTITIVNDCTYDFTKIVISNTAGDIQDNETVTLSPNTSYTWTGFPGNYKVWVGDTDLSSYLTKSFTLSRNSSETLYIKKDSFKYETATITKSK